MTIELKLDDDFRKDLNNQANIQNEMRFNVVEVPFKEYMKNEHTSTAPITTKILKLLFEQYPEYKALSEKKEGDGLIISTFRTTVLTPSGINGESNWHTDNILFPRRKNRNLLITWGPGTEALSYEDSRKYNLDYEEYRNIAKTAKTQEDIIKYGEMYFDEFEPEKYVENRKLKIYKSESPNAEGNITALIITGTDVLHRRAPADQKNIGTLFRYALNIYYDSNDLINACVGAGAGAGAAAGAGGAGLGGGKRKRTRKIKKYSTKRT